MIDRHRLKLAAVIVLVIVVAVLAAIGSEWMWPTTGVAN